MITSPKRILVVDDENRDRNLLQAMVKLLGHQPEAASDGTEAFVKLSSSIDLVLLDVLMPGIDGFEVARQIRNHPDCADVPVIMVSGLMSKEDRLRAVEAGANDFIAKPVEELELRVRTASLLKLKEAQDAVKRHAAELEKVVARRTASLHELVETSANIVQGILSGLLIYQFQAPGELFLVNGNPEAERLIGMSIKESRGQEFDEMWPNARRQGLTQSLLRTMETGEVFETEDAYYKVEEFERFFRLRGFPIPGDLLGVAFMDITEQKRAEAVLRAAHSERKMSEQERSVHR